LRCADFVRLRWCGFRGAGHLNTPTQAGSTVFHDIPLEVRATAGNAVFFAYDQADLSSRRLHGRSPVLEGEKWVGVRWFGQGPRP
jgi:prolyl 4-hydroxylase